ncbi:MAG TPA: hypothetical protein ENN73_04460, partial [Firmicutes bacterium]|nr:hypothetical protein [Bacillota bacterium]
MCSVIVIVPVILAWPIFASAALSIAAQMGFNVTKKKIAALKEDELSAQTKTVYEKELDKSNVMGETMSYEEQLIIQSGDFQVLFEKTPRGKVKMVVTGENHSHEELAKIGKEVMDKIIQRYSLEVLKKELQSRGFEISEEE